MPLLWLGYNIAGEVQLPGSRLGADPGEAVVLYLGDWTIRILLLTLTVSSARRLARAPRLLRIRRAVGLYAFAYVALHFLGYLVFLAELDWQLIEEDLVKRRYITVGFLALVLLIPMAITSTNRLRRRLGRRWVQLHKLIYLIVPLGLLHLFWLTKDGYGEPFAYLLGYLVLMFERYRAGVLSR